MVLAALFKFQHMYIYLRRMFENVGVPLSRMVSRGAAIVAAVAVKE